MSGYQGDGGGGGSGFRTSVRFTDERFTSAASKLDLVGVAAGGHDPRGVITSFTAGSWVAVALWVIVDKIWCFYTAWCEKNPLLCIYICTCDSIQDCMHGLIRGAPNIPTIEIHFQRAHYSDTYKPTIPINSPIF